VGKGRDVDMKNKIEKIRLEKHIGALLAFRDYVDDLFEEINRVDANVIELDFEGVEFMSRSFAHEYLLRKSKSEKDIYEKNKCPSIQNMLSVVERSFKNPRKIRVTPTSHPIKIA